MDVEDVDKQAKTNLYIVEYLKRKGYIEAARQLEPFVPQVQSANQLAENISKLTDQRIVNVIRTEENPTKYEESYTAFKDWTITSLDAYRPELMSLLYPIFVHCYLDLIEKGHRTEGMKFLATHRGEHSERYRQEIGRLTAVTTSEHMKENQLVQDFRKYKFSISMCSYAFELMTTYLHERGFLLLLSIINHYLSIKVHPGQPQPRDPDTILTPFSGESEEKIIELEKSQIYWGLYPEQRKFSDAMLDTTFSADTSPKLTLPALYVLLICCAETIRNQQTTDKIINDLKKKVIVDSTPTISLYTLFHSYDSLTRTRLSSRGDLVASGFSDSTIKLWDLSQEKSQWNEMTQLYIDNDGRNPKWKPKKRTEESDSFNLLAHSGPVYGLSFSPDSQFLLSSSQDSTVRLWSMATKTNVVCYRGHSSPVWDVEFSPLGYYFATAGHDKTARFWSTNSVYALRIFAGHLSDVNCVKFHPNSCYLLTGSNDRCLRFWDIHAGSCVRVFTGHYSPVYSLATSPDGRFIASSGDDMDINLWDLASSKRATTFKGHSKTVWSLDFSKEGHVLASGSADGTIRLWDVRMCREEIVRKEAKEKKKSEGVVPMADETSERRGDGEDEEEEDANINKCLGTYPTKRTPVYSLHFTHSNLLCAAGPFQKDK